MKSWIIWGSLMTAMFVSYFAQMTLTQDMQIDMSKQTSYVWAWYVAEASVEKELLALKSDDINKIVKFNEISWQWIKENSEYWFINEWADSWYFDLELSSTPSLEVDLWTIIWGDIVFEWLSNNDYFDTFLLNYNKSTTSDILLEIIKSDNSGTFESCDFYEEVEDSCSQVSKQVINTNDLTLHWSVLDWLQVYFETWDDWFSNKLKVQWFNVNSFDYRLSFSTLKGDSIAFAYYVQSGWVTKPVANNLIEIDTVGTAIDNFARLKLQKRITNDIQSNSKYVLFSDWEIAK